MGWSVGFENGRDVGYGVPAVCDQPDCGEEIDRGLSYRCGEYGEDNGCGRFFCHQHLHYAGDDDACYRICERCRDGLDPFPPSSDTDEWLTHKETDPSWAEWRAENPERPRPQFDGDAP